MPEWIKQFLTSGAMAAFVGAILVWRFNTRLANKARRADYLRGQIQNVYGPLTYYFEAGHRAFMIHKRIGAAYDEYFKNRHGADVYSEQMTAVIEVQNAYAARTVGYNREATGVLKANWGWLDPDDLEAVGNFLTEVERGDVESSEKKVKLPVDFYLSGVLKNALSAPIIYRLDLVQRVQEKLRAKQQELLTGKPQKPAKPPREGGTSVNPEPG